MNYNTIQNVYIFILIQHTSIVSTVLTDISGMHLFSLSMLSLVLNEPPRGKTNNVVFEQVRHTPSCTSTEECYMLDILDISRRGIALSV